jgi:hypothetical protein
MSETTASSEERKNASVANATNALVEPTEENLHKVTNKKVRDKKEREREN